MKPLDLPLPSSPSAFSAVRSALALTALAIVAACAPIQPSNPGASTVRLTHQEPGDRCTFLGDATGNQGDFLLGQVMSNADLETGARNDLKNKAAALGGNVVVLLTQRAGQTGSKDHLAQTNVTLSGNVYRCPRA